MFSSEITELSITRENASASPPRIIVLIGAAHQVQHDERGQRRERNGKKHRRGGAQIPQKQQDHEAGQHQADQAFVQHRLDRLLHEHRLIEQHVGLHLLRDIEQMPDHVADAVAPPAMVLVSPPCFRIGM